MHVHVVDVNKDRIFFLFGVLRPAKHKRRLDHNLQEAHFLECFDRCSDYTITKHELKLQTLAKQWRSMKGKAFPKISENSSFRSFELPIIRKDYCGPWLFE